MGHVAVLLHEAIDGLNLKAGGVFLDVTVGSAGHALEVFRRFKDEVHIIGLDADAERVQVAAQVLAQEGSKAVVVKENFRNLDHALASQGIRNVAAILFDLGLNTEQLETSGRGFSFLHNEPLYMTFDAPESGMLTAYEIVNHYDERAIADILFTFGEERYSRRIARAIVLARKGKPIQTTSDLVEIIRAAVPKGYEHGRIHFATRTFQALRIAVNDELGALTEGLQKGFAALAPHGRMAVISFHSLEDRIVKRFFKEQASRAQGTLITKKPLVPTEDEQQENPRSRSAKLRIIEKN